MLKFKFPFLIILLAVLAGKIFSFDNHQLEGKWLGNISKENQNWALEINFYQDKGKLNGYFNLPDYGLYNLPFSIISVTDTIIRLEYGDKKPDAIFSGKIENSVFSGAWNGLGIDAEFRTSKNNETPEIFRTEDVSFESGDAVLSGTLILPPGEGPFPAVVHIHGSGNQTRNEEFYRSRAFMLAGYGIASLIYDRRGKGKSTGEKVSMELLADDAVSGVRFLSSNPLIKKSKIGLLGVSQGGYIAPLAVSRSNDISFMVVVSAPGISPDEQNDFNVESRLMGKNVAGDTVKMVLQLRKDIRAYLYNGKGNIETLQASIISIKDKPWFKNTFIDTVITVTSQGEINFLTFNPLPVWEKVRIPVLAVWGDMDNLVPAEKSRELIKQSLDNGGNTKYTLKIFENSGHGIAIVKTGSTFSWPVLAPGYHAMIAEWIKQNAQ